MSQNFSYPPGFATAVNPSVSTNGDLAPLSSTQVGGINPSGDLKALTVDALDYLYVNVASSVAPTGSATSANQVLEIAQLTAINGKLPATLGQTTSSGSLAVVIASDQSALPISAASLPLPTGASTSALQTQISGQLPSTLGAKLTAASLAVNIASDQTVPVSGSVTVSGTVAATQSGVWNITDISGTVSLPTGASTAALQTTGNTSLSSIVTNTTGVSTSANQVTISAQLPTTLGAKTTANSLAVNIASDQTLNSKIAGKTAVTKARNDYSSVNVTTSAYVQLIASTPATISELFIFDSSGQTLVLATGAAASEVDQIYIIPGGNGTVPLSITSGTRISIKAVSATASVGEIDVNFFG